MISKLLDLKKIDKFRKKQKNKKIVLCHGVFDVMHYGHINYFNSAKQNGDI